MENVHVNYQKRIFTILLLVVIAAIIYLGNDILFPIILAFIFGVLIRPIDAFFQHKWHFPKLLSVIITVAIAIIIFAAILLLLGFQLKDFFSDLPTLEKNMMKVIHDLGDWINKTFGVTNFQQEKIVKENFMKGGKFLSMKNFGSFTGALVNFILVPLYLFLFLFYRELLLGFLNKLVPPKSSERMQIIVNDIKVIIRMYILGLLLEIAIVATLTTLGLWLIGVKYALFLGLLVSLLNLIPYVGILVANFLSCLISLSNNPSLEQSVLGVIAVIGAVQLIDNNILLPRVVGSKVRINALASIICVIVGGSLAGVPGMFLAIPITAIIKVVFDAVPNLEPYGYLLGDEMPKALFWTKKKEVAKQIVKEQIRNPHPDKPKAKPKPKPKTE
ncbi:AI-2E family transporter [Fluviicola chungangensis]|uniref:AI-2E family transporter n=1 Tax=Fluviicola chungangensis TaxID=2597671 RepID=A0A556N6J0_9FLAO|nr:AI-2E family transporter [Fluviicola chungangensis]TSJ47738.1 AI-2E family transporter [Fluviicola chungangensis]